MKKNLIAFAFGLLGLAVACCAWHLWQDHHNLHALVAETVMRIQAQQQQQAAPKPEPPK